MHRHPEPIGRLLLRHGFDAGGDRHHVLAIASSYLGRRKCQAVVLAVFVVPSLELRDMPIDDSPQFFRDDHNFRRMRGA